eukprot:scaffold22163_cov47-Phaeocystis_antarctica.AAC.3
MGATRPIASSKPICSKAVTPELGQLRLGQGLETQFPLEVAAARPAARPATHRSGGAQPGGS